MSKTSRLALVAAACLLTGSAAMAQTAGPTASHEATGMDGKTLNGAPLPGTGTPGAGTPGAGLGGAGTGGTGPGEPGKAPAMGNSSAGAQPAPAVTGAKAAP